MPPDPPVPSLIPKDPTLVSRAAPCGPATYCSPCSRRTPGASSIGQDPRESARLCSGKSEKVSPGCSADYRRLSQLLSSPDAWKAFPCLWAPSRRPPSSPSSPFLAPLAFSSSPQTHSRCPPSQCRTQVPSHAPLSTAPPLPGLALIPSPPSTGGTARCPLLSPPPSQRRPVHPSSLTDVVVGLSRQELEAKGKGCEALNLL